MDIGSGERYPSAALSNFAPHPFEFRTISAASMEGLLQGLKFSNPEMQKQVMSLVGRMAKAAGRHKNWQRNGLLYWQGDAVNRFEKEYQTLLDEAFWSLYSQNDAAKRALLATREAVLTHTIGKRKPQETVLTRSEFTSRLILIRDSLANKGSNRFSGLLVTPNTQ